MSPGSPMRLMVEPSVQAPVLSLPSKRFAADGRATQQTVCRECGKEFKAKRVTAEFCSGRCRTAFHNRKAARGSVFYDLFMLVRFDRDAADRDGLWSELCKGASAFKAEDDAERNGRRSWDSADQIGCRHTRLKAKVVGTNVAGARR
jgi:hypothetical protein